MNQQEKLEFLLRKIGLLRARLSKITQNIVDVIQACKKNYCDPPDALIVLYGKSQDTLGLLLKASRLLTTNPDEKVIPQLGEIFSEVNRFLEELAKNTTPDLDLQPCHEGLDFVREALQACQ
jgi:hypothetical protein